MARHPAPGVPLTGTVTSDPLIRKVLAAEARAAESQRELAALRLDRKQLLDEYTAMRKARPVPVSPAPGKRGKADRVRVSVGDLHGMRQDPAAVAAFLADVRLLSPDEIVLGGDMLECGGWLAKHQPIGFIALLDYTYQEDVAATNAFLDALQTAAPRASIDYLEGQHEDRVERWIVDQVTANARDAEFLRRLCAPPALLRLADRQIGYYRRAEIYVEGAPRGWIQRGLMYFTHELGTSKNAARDALGKTAANVTYFHTHREDTATAVFPSVGICKAFNPGCLCTMQPVWRNSDVTNWSQGYAVDFLAKSEKFLRVHVPIWRGESLASAWVERIKA